MFFFLIFTCHCFAVGVEWCLLLPLVGQGSRNFVLLIVHKIHLAECTGFI
jgi:hypothetical protein